MKTNNYDNYKIFSIKIIIIILMLSIIILLYNMLNIILILFFSLFLTVLFSPFLNKLNKRKINDFFGILIIFFILSILIFVVFLSIIPIIVNQSNNFFESINNGVNNIKAIYNQGGIKGFGLPIMIENLLTNLNIEQILNFLKENTDKIYDFFGTNAKNFLTSGAGIISGFGSIIFNFIMVLILTFFITLERENIRKFFYSIIPRKIGQYIYNNEKDVTTTLAEWLKGQLFIGFCMFILTLIGLLILKLFGIDIDGIITLSIIAGFMSFIPFIGTFISFFIAIAVSLGSGIEGVIGVLIVYFIIQQIEGNVLIPFIMGKTLSLTPFSVLLVMLIGGSLFGIIGIIFAVPFLAVINIFLKPYILKRQKEECIE